MRSLRDHRPLRARRAGVARRRDRAGARRGSERLGPRRAAVRRHRGSRPPRSPGRARLRRAAGLAVLDPRAVRAAPRHPDLLRARFTSSRLLHGSSPHEPPERSGPRPPGPVFFLPQPYARIWSLRAAVRCAPRQGSTVGLVLACAFLASNSIRPRSLRAGMIRNCRASGVAVVSVIQPMGSNCTVRTFVPPTRRPSPVPSASGLWQQIRPRCRRPIM
jgi:hypothetical protein